MTERALTEAEIAAMVARAEPHADHSSSACESARDVPRLAADLRRAREALRPFAEEFERHVERYLRRGDPQIMQGNFNRMPDDWPVEKFSITMGHCRAARAALGEDPADDGA